MRNFQKTIAAFALLAMAGGAMGYAPRSAVVATYSLRASSAPSARNVFPDPNGNVTNSTDARGRTEGFAFDALGRQTAFTNSEGHVYRMAFDAQGRLLAATNAMGEQVFRNYFDPCGNLTNKVDAASRRVLYQYDVLNRCTNTIYADGTKDAFTFDAVGNLLTARNAATTNTFTYNVMNLLTSSVSRVAGVAFTNRYRYDLGGLATNIVYPGNKTVRYFYNADGQVTNVVDWSNRVYHITRDAAGRITALTYPNGISGAFGYDASHAVTNWGYTGSTNLPCRQITRDTMGLKIREDITSGPMPKPSTNRRAVNTFDAADRLTSAQVGTGTNPVIVKRDGPYLHIGHFESGIFNDSLR